MGTLHFVSSSSELFDFIQMWTKWNVSRTCRLLLHCALQIMEKPRCQLGTQANGLFLHLASACPYWRTVTAKGKTSHGLLVMIGSLPSAAIRIRQRPAQGCTGRDICLKGSVQPREHFSLQSTLKPQAQEAPKASAWMHRLQYWMQCHQQRCAESYWVWW